jgi:hypothetical protein
MHEVHVLDAAAALDLVATFEQLEIASIPAKDMECSICYLRFDESSPVFDNSPVKTRCFRRTFGDFCYIEALGNYDLRPMCRRHVDELNIVLALAVAVPATQAENAPSAPSDTDSLASCHPDINDSTESP